MPTSKVASPLAQAQGDLLGVAQHPAQLAQGPGRHQHVLALGAAAWCPAGRARPAGRSRWPPGAGRPARRPSARRSRMGRASSLLAARTTWRRASARAAASRVTASPAGSGRRGNSSAGSTRTVNWERPAEICASPPSRREGDGAGLQGPDDVGAQPGGETRHAVVDAGDGGLDLRW